MRTLLAVHLTEQVVVKNTLAVHLRDQAVVMVGWKLEEPLVMWPGACMAGGRMSLLVPEALEGLGTFKIGF